MLAGYNNSCIYIILVFKQIDTGINEPLMTFHKCIELNCQWLAFNSISYPSSHTFHTRGVRYLYFLTSPLLILNHIFIYSKYPHIFPNNTHPLFLCPTLFLISFYTYFIHLLKLHLRISFFMFKLSHLPAMSVTLKLPPIYSFLILSNLVTPYIHLNILISAISILKLPNTWICISLLASPVLQNFLFTFNGFIITYYKK